VRQIDKCAVYVERSPLTRYGSLSAVLHLSPSEVGGTYGGAVVTEGMAVLCENSPVVMLSSRSSSSSLPAPLPSALNLFRYYP